ncbi:MAG: hypothetical protein LBT00_13325 [Spirochaetaceae bacterium]|jgi:hypothetical protein|nr:hypothetical protein [Spirochaetaceae bacterium]
MTFLQLADLLTSSVLTVQDYTALDVRQAKLVCQAINAASEEWFRLAPLLWRTRIETLPVAVGQQLVFPTERAKIFNKNPCAILSASNKRPLILRFDVAACLARPPTYTGLPAGFPHSYAIVHGVPADIPNDGSFPSSFEETPLLVRLIPAPEVPVEIEIAYEMAGFSVSTTMMQREDGGGQVSLPNIETTFIPIAQERLLAHPLARSDSSLVASIRGHYQELMSKRGLGLPWFQTPVNAKLGHVNDGIR